MLNASASVCAWACLSAPSRLGASLSSNLQTFPQSIPHWSVPPFLALQAPFQARQEEGRLRLLTLLQRIMIRASKDELINLGIPRLHSKVGCPLPPGCHQPPLPPVVSAASPAPAANAVPSSAAACVRPLCLLRRTCGDRCGLNPLRCPPPCR